TRRVIHVRLDVLDEYPELRQGFRHPNLIPWIRAERPRLLAAALTILSAFCRAGRPTHGLEAFGSFEGWSSLVREAVVWLGMDDPCLTRHSLAQIADTTGDAVAQFLGAWRACVPQGEGVVLGELISRLYHDQPLDDASSALRAAMDNLMNARSE